MKEMIEQALDERGREKKKKREARRRREISDIFWR
jgi:hypothetical protein